MLFCFCFLFKLKWGIENTMRIWKEHYRTLKQLILAVDSLQTGGRVVLTAPNYQNLEFEVDHRDENGAIARLCRWFEHPSGDSFPDGGMEIKIDHGRKEVKPISLQTPTYAEEGMVLPPFDKTPDEALRTWLRTLHRLGFKAQSLETDVAPIIPLPPR